MTLSSTMSVYTLGDLMWADFWWRFPTLRFSLTEGDIGWIPYFLQRAEHVQDRHSGWTRHSFPDGTGPRDVFLEHILCCFINDAVGVKLIDRLQRRQRVLGVRLPALRLELARTRPEMLEPLLAELSDAQINKITHENAMRHYQFDPFSIRPKEQCTVAALRAEATDVDVVTRVGRRSDESDLEAWKALTNRGRALNAQTR